MWARTVLGSSGLWGLLASGAAWAAEVAVPPLVPGPSSPEALADVHGELVEAVIAEGAFEAVRASDLLPERLDEGCLADVRCLEAVAIGLEAPAMIAGQLVVGGTVPELRLVYYRGGQIVRMRAGPVPEGARASARAVRVLVHALLTGEAVPAAPVVELPARRERARIRGRAGWSRYGPLDFVAGELDVSVGVVGGLSVVGGAAVFAVERRLPPPLENARGGDRVWNALAPLSLGLQYGFGRGAVQPYVGLDGVTGMYHRDDDGRMHWALGGRARLGADWMITDAVGLNLHGAVGAWWGDAWEDVEDGIPTSGRLWLASAGVVIPISR